MTSVEVCRVGSSNGYAICCYVAYCEVLSICVVLLRCGLTAVRMSLIMWTIIVTPKNTRVRISF